MSGPTTTVPEGLTGNPAAARTVTSTGGCRGTTAEGSCCGSATKTQAVAAGRALASDQPDRP
jgi:hypothetical protein